LLSDKIRLLIVTMFLSAGVRPQF